jgi:thiosulfate reductase cytochrome b subunit
MAKDTISSAGDVVHPLWLRMTHWINVVAVVVLLMSGWRIYNASPIFAFQIPKVLTLGGWLGGSLQWHFAAMWLLVVNGFVYISVNAASGRFLRKYIPLRLKDLMRDFLNVFKGKLSHDNLLQYNALQKLAYLFVVFDLILIIASGLVIWKSVQFPLLRDLMGGYDTARIVHFTAMTALLGFIIVHIVMVALVPRTLILITRGR